MKTYTYLLLAGTLALSACTGDQAGTGIAYAATLDLIAVADTGQVPVFRRVWERDARAVSPDGRYVAYPRWAGTDVGNLAITDLRTGEERFITNLRPPDFAEAPVFSPDGRYVAYMLGNVGAGPDGEGAYEFRMVEIGDTTQQLLYSEGRWGWYFQVSDWNADQGMLVEIDDTDVPLALATFRPGDDAPGIIREFDADGPHPHGGKFSPNGRFVAFNLGDDIFTIPTTGGEPTDLGLGPAEVMGWTGTGELIVHTWGSGSGRIWSVRMDEGRPVGEAVLLKGDVHGLAPLNPSSDAFFYVQAIDAPKIFAATIDVERGGFVVAPTPVTSVAGGAAGTPRWSPDGRSFIYTKRALPNHQQWDIVLQSWDGRDVRVLATLDERIWNLSWHPDGQSVLFTDGQPRVLNRLDIRTGQATILHEFNGRPALTMTPDGRSIIAVTGGDGEPHTLASIDLETGTERLLATIPRPDWLFYAPVLSPDGRSIALTGGRPFDDGPSALFVVPTEGGEAREIYRVEDGGSRNGPAFPAWTPDSEAVLVTLGQSLIAVPAAGGPHRVVLDAIRQPGPSASDAWSLHPDGRRILFVDGRWVRETWTMEQVPSIR